MSIYKTLEPTLYFETAIPAIITTALATTFFVYFLSKLGLAKSFLNSLKNFMFEEVSGESLLLLRIFLASLAEKISLRPRLIGLLEQARTHGHSADWGLFYFNFIIYH